MPSTTLGKQSFRVRCLSPEDASGHLIGELSVEIGERFEITFRMSDRDARRTPRAFAHFGPEPSRDDLINSKPSK